MNTNKIGATLSGLSDLMSCISGEMANFSFYDDTKVVYATRLGLVEANHTVSGNKIQLSNFVFTNGNKYMPIIESISTNVSLGSDVEKKYILDAIKYCTFLESSRKLLKKYPNKNITIKESTKNSIKKTMEYANKCLYGILGKNILFEFGIYEPNFLLETSYTENKDGTPIVTVDIDGKTVHDNVIRYRINILENMRKSVLNACSSMCDNNALEVTAHKINEAFLRKDLQKVDLYADEIAKESPEFAYFPSSKFIDAFKINCNISMDFQLVENIILSARKINKNSIIHLIECGKILCQNENKIDINNFEDIDELSNEIWDNDEKSLENWTIAYGKINMGIAKLIRDINDENEENYDEVDDCISRLEEYSQLLSSAIENEEQLPMDRFADICVDICSIAIGENDKNDIIPREEDAEEIIDVKDDDSAETYGISNDKEDKLYGIVGK